MIPLIKRITNFDTEFPNRRQFRFCLFNVPEKSLQTGWVKIREAHRNNRSQRRHMGGQVAKAVIMCLETRNSREPNWSASTTKVVSGRAYSLKCLPSLLHSFAWSCKRSPSVSNRFFNSIPRCLFSYRCAFSSVSVMPNTSTTQVNLRQRNPFSGLMRQVYFCR